MSSLDTGWNPTMSSWLSATGWCYTNYNVIEVSATGYPPFWNFLTRWTQWTLIYQLFRASALWRLSPVKCHLFFILSPLKCLLTSRFTQPLSARHFASCTLDSFRRWLHGLERSWWTRVSDHRKQGLNILFLVGWGWSLNLCNLW